MTSKYDNVIIPAAFYPMHDNPVTPTSGPTMLNDGEALTCDVLKEMSAFHHVAAPGSMSTTYRTSSGRRRSINVIQA